MPAFNPKEHAIIRYLYQIDRFAPAYEIAQGTGISLTTVQKYLIQKLKRYVESRVKGRYPVVVDKKEVIRTIHEYRFKTEMVREYLKNKMASGERS